jgi:glycosyltransferase involved in cell wall biosynthesis
VERPVRVLHVITRLILGGAQENTLLTVIGQQRDPRFRVTLLAGIDLGPEGNLHERARLEGVDLVLLPSLVRPIRPLADLRALLALYRVMKSGRFDIVHTHSSKAGILGRIAAHAAGVPVVIHTLHSLVFHEYQAAWKNRLYVGLKRMCAPWTDVIISVNDKTRYIAIASGVGRPEQHVTIHSGMDLTPFVSVSSGLTVEAAKRRLGIPEDALVVGKIARLFPLKGHDLFFEAAERIARAEPRAHFLLVGNGTLRAELEARARTLGLLPRTLFTGLVPPEQVPAHIQAMDVVVHCSLREGIARVLPQAGAVGKPVVAFHMDGAPEVIREGVSGYLVPPRDTAALADRALFLLGNPALREAFGQEGRRVAVESFGLDRMVSAINAVYWERLRRLPERAHLAPTEPWAQSPGGEEAPPTGAPRSGS